MDQTQGAVPVLADTKDLEADSIKEYERLLAGEHYLRPHSLPSVGISLTLAALASAEVIPALIIVGIIKRLIGRGEDGILSPTKPGRVQRRESKTAMLVAATRYIGYREGWTDDALSRHFLPGELRLAIDFTLTFNKRFQLSLKSLGYLMARTIAGDRLIRNINPAQIVLLGAGLDTRAHRLELPVDCRFFEVDIATTQAFKRKIAARYPKEFKGHVTYVAVDFSSESFIEKLKEAPGFDPKCTNTLILFEGVSMYLKWPALEETMRMISTGLPVGTYVGMDVVEDMVTSPEARRRRSQWRGAKAVTSYVKHIGEPFQWGIPIGKTPQDVFQPLGFHMVGDIHPKEMDRLFFTPKNKSGKPIAHCPGYGHYLIMRVSSKEPLASET